MTETQFVRGWATLADGTRIETTADDAAEMWKMFEAIKAKRAAAYPTTHDALCAFLDATERMRDLGWRTAIFGVEDGDEFAIAEQGSTGIFRAVWIEPYLHYQDCVAHMGEHYIKRLADLTDAERLKMVECESSHAEFRAHHTKAMQATMEALTPPTQDGGE